MTDPVISPPTSAVQQAVDGTEEQHGGEPAEREADERHHPAGGGAAARTCAVGRWRSGVVRSDMVDS